MIPGDFFRQRRWHTAASTPSDPFRIINGPTVLTVTTSSIQVTWGLSEIATGQIEYGLTIAYGSATTEQDLAGGYDFHTQTMSNLLPGTLYYWRVKSTNAGGTTVYGSGQTTTTDVVVPPDPGTEYPPLLNMSLRALQTLPMPGMTTPSTDPVFGTQVIRVSNVIDKRHRYSAKAAWSATGRYLLLDYLSGNRSLLDGDTYAQLIQDCSTGTHFMWDPVDDSLGWCASGVSMQRVDVTNTSFTRSTVATLSQYASVSPGGGEGSPSNDGRYIALKVQQGSLFGVAVFDTSSLTVTSSRVLATQAINNCSMSPSGDYVLVQYGVIGTGSTQGTWCYPRSFSTGVNISNSLSHRDVVRDPTDSFDQVVMPGSGGVYAYRMSNGSAIQLCGTTSRIHVSGRCHRYPGYAVISPYSVPGEGGNYTWAGYGEVFMLKTDGSEFAQSRPFAQTHRAASLGYVGEVHASASPYGERVIFTSEWAQSGGIGGAGVYAFVAGMEV